MHPKAPASLRRLIIRWRHQDKPEPKAEGDPFRTTELDPVGAAVKLTIAHTIEPEASKLIEAVLGGWPRIISTADDYVDGHVRVANASRDRLRFSPANFRSRHNPYPVPGHYGLGSRTCFSLTAAGATFPIRIRKCRNSPSFKPRLFWTSSSSALSAGSREIAWASSIAFQFSGCIFNPSNSSPV